MIWLPLVVVLSGPVTPQAASAQPGRPLFAEWLQRFRADAAASGISEGTLDRALTGLEPLPVVVARDRSQSELLLSVREYVKQRVTRRLVRAAREANRRYGQLLRRVERKYGVPRQVVVAVWGLESNFGRFSGVRPTIPTLATLAWDGRREQLFRRELLTALGILDRGEVAFDRLKGSWAGAMGQTQFLPSSYVRYAQDFDGDGRKDIWTSLPDVFASIADYLRESGWEPGKPWGIPVKVPARASRGLGSLLARRANGCLAERDLSLALPVEQWRSEGLRPDRRLPRGTSASLLRLGRSDFLVTTSYEAILAYNCAHSYAMSVVQLADAIGAPAAPAVKRARRR